MIVAGYVNRDRIKLKIASVTSSVPPKASDSQNSGKRVAGAVTGDAPWALSALPECFAQERKVTGSLRYVVGHLAMNAIPVQIPETLHYGDCTVRVIAETVFVDRGSDHMRIPPPARLYFLPGVGLALLQKTTHGRYDLRTYQVTSALP